MYIDKVLPQRQYIKDKYLSDKKYNIRDTPHENNAYGTLAWAFTDSGGHAREIPVICGHGGSMWLCYKCKEDTLTKQKGQK